MGNQQVTDDDKRVLIQTRQNRRCRQLFNIYTGQAMAMMLDPLSFLMKTELLKRNLTMFRDLSRNVFLGANIRADPGPGRLY